MMARILVIGVGVVGTAVMNGLKYLGHDVKGWDKYNPQWISNPEEKIRLSEYIFVCVPTPTSKWGIDLSAINETMNLIRQNNFLGIVVLKSTVLPGTAEQMKNLHFLRIVSNPEFLTEANAKIDFLTNRIVLGGNTDDCNEVMKNVYSHAIGKIPVYSYPSNSYAEAIKYMSNCFLATKVVFANEFNHLCKKWKIDYSDMMSAVGADPRIGRSHLNINKIHGYGGHCFPKDMKALAKQSKFIDMIDKCNKKNMGPKA